jgi:large subunit ribosomal protein L28
MSRICNVTAKKTISGNNVSHAKNRRKRTFKVNLHTHTFILPKTGDKIKLRLSNKGLRTIDKLGLTGN